MNWSDYSQYLVDYCKKKGIPSSASFELTPLCNFNCNMCYIHLTPEQANKQGKLLTTAQWIHIAEETKRLGTFGMELTGGEAVTRADFPVIYEEIVKMGFLVALRTNGYLLCGDLLALLVKYKPRVVNVTLYGSSDETYHKICGVENGFSVVTRNVFEMIDAGINVRLTVTLTKENKNDQDDLVRWARTHGVFLNFYGGLITPIRSAKRSIDHLKVDYLLQEDLVDMQVNQRETLDRDKYMHPFWMCKEFGTKFCISWDGRMTLCNCLPSIWSDVLKQNVDEAFHSLYRQLNLVNRPKECATCNYIDYCGACPARFLSDAGSHDRTCESICEKARKSYFISLKHSLRSYTTYNERIERSCIDED